MANGSNGVLMKIVLGALLTILFAAGGFYVKTVGGQITATSEASQQMHADDSTALSQHDSLPMHEGSRLQFEKLERRYIRDSASTAQFRQTTNDNFEKLEKGISGLTEWLKSNTNHDSANGQP